MSVVTTIVSSSSSTASSNEGEVPRANHAAPSEAMRSGRASLARFVRTCSRKKGSKCEARDAVIHVNVNTTDATTGATAL